ncbi:MAG TPA: hypothetical protein VKQ34_03275, partial [Candidatus Saccharimonadales bacterium]|nr:hypothetical protein [Candidatus Saccharimonadales bacterium]
STIEYRQVSSTEQIAYKDIQKIAYHVTAGGGKYGSSARRWMDMFVAGRSKPIRVPISIFRTRDTFALLHVVLQKNPAVLLGDTIAQGLDLGFIPSKLPPVVFGRFEKQDDNFVSAASVHSGAPNEVTEEVRPHHLVLSFVQLVLVLAFLYFFWHLAFGPLALCFGALLVVQLVGIAVRPPSGR